MRTVAQPGPSPAERIQWVEARGRRVVFHLEPGRLLIDAVRESFAAEGFTSGVLTLAGGALDPLAYVIPAPAPTDRHAAFYSATFRPPGMCRIRTGALTFGTRDGAPFFHCHAVWTEAAGQPRGGHILPDATAVAEPIRAVGIGLAGAAFVAEPDAETNFTLFGPVAQEDGTAKGDGPVFVLRLRPNQDLTTALESFCQERGIGAALLHGGVGSIVGAYFTNGSRVDALATEMVIRSGQIGPGGNSALASEVEVALVDPTGAVSEGLLVRGDNPILMTLEVVLEPV